MKKYFWTLLILILANGFLIYYTVIAQIQVSTDIEMDFTLKFIDYFSNFLTFLTILFLPFLAISSIIHIFRKKIFWKTTIIGGNIYHILLLAFLSFSFYGTIKTDYLPDFESIKIDSSMQTEKIRLGEFYENDYIILRDSFSQKTIYNNSDKIITRKVEWKSDFEYWLIGEDTIKVKIFEVGNNYYNCYTNYNGKAIKHKLQRK